jgi:small subunit ribosomal protein S2
MSYNFTIRELLEAGVHFGHKKNFWNPKMLKYIYGTRNGVHIVDLQQTALRLKQALDVLKEIAANNGRVLFVGTKRSASELVAEFAKSCGQYYVNHRWLGGMLTNWNTVSNSIRTLQKYEGILSNPNSTLTKKEKLDLDRKRIKLDNVLGGIRNMGGKPDALFVIDAKQEQLAIAEARALNIPIIAVVDTNSNPDNIDYVIPGNDDARKAIEIYSRLASEAILTGMQESLANSGVDISTIEVNMEQIANNDSDLAEELLSKAEEGEKSKTKKAPVVTKKKKPAAKAKSKTNADSSEEASA